MRKAIQTDLKLVVTILSASFDTNQSINYVVKQDSKRKKRLHFLMKYSFLKSLYFGDVFISDDETACLLMLKKNSKTSLSLIVYLKSFLLDVKLVFKSIGLKNILKVIQREKSIKKHQPKTPFLHLWYVGVLPKSQGKNIGSELLQSALNYYKNPTTIYLETSTEKNFNFYNKLGFDKTTVIDLGYDLFVYKKNMLINV